MLIALVLSAAAIVALVVLGFRLANQQSRSEIRAFRTTPRSTLAEATPARPVKLVGTLLLAGAPVTAPLSVRPCAIYEAGLEWPPGRKTVSHRHLLHAGILPPVGLPPSNGGPVRERGAAPLLIHDGESVARIAWDDAVVVYGELWSEEDAPIGADFRPPRGLAAFLARHAVAREPADYFERLIMPGERVGVIGIVSEDVAPKDAASSSDHAAAKPRVVNAPAGGKLLITKYRELLD